MSIYTPANRPTRRPSAAPNRPPASPVRRTPPAGQGEQQRGPRPPISEQQRLASAANNRRRAAEGIESTTQNFGQSLLSDLRGLPQRLFGMALPAGRPTTPPSGGLSNPSLIPNSPSSQPTPNYGRETNPPSFAPMQMPKGGRASPLLTPPPSSPTIGPTPPGQELLPFMPQPRRGAFGQPAGTGPGLQPTTYGAFGQGAPQMPPPSQVPSSALGNFSSPYSGAAELNSRVAGQYGGTTSIPSSPVSSPAVAPLSAMPTGFSLPTPPPGINPVVGGAAAPPSPTTFSSPYSGGVDQFNRTAGQYSAPLPQGYAPRSSPLSIPPQTDQNAEAARLTGLANRYGATPQQGLSSTPLGPPAARPALSQGISSTPIGPAMPQGISPTPIGPNQPPINPSRPGIAEQQQIIGQQFGVPDTAQVDKLYSLQTDSTWQELGFSNSAEGMAWANQQRQQTGRFPWEGSGSFEDNLGQSLQNYYGGGGATASPGGAGGASAPSGGLTPPPTSGFSGGPGQPDGGGFGPFPSFQVWQQAFAAEHDGRPPNEVDVQDALASFDYLNTTGESPTTRDWKRRYYTGGFFGDGDFRPTQGYGSLPLAQASMAGNSGVPQMPGLPDWMGGTSAPGAMNTAGMPGSVPTGYSGPWAASHYNQPIQHGVGPWPWPGQRTNPVPVMAEDGTMVPAGYYNLQQWTNQGGGI